MMTKRGTVSAERPQELAFTRPDEARHPTEIVLLDRAGVIAWVNEAWRDFARDNDADPATAGVGASYLAACAAAGDDPDAIAVADAIRAALRGELPAPIAVCIPCDSSTEDRWFDVLISERRDDSGELVGAALALMRRVAAPGAENGLRTPGGADPFVDHAALVRSAPDAVMCADTAGRAYAANPAACVLLGRTESQLLALDPGELVDPADRGSWVEAYAAVVGDGSFRGELAVLRADGSSIPVEVSAWGFSAGGGAGFAVILRDATELVERRRSEVLRGARELILVERERIVEAVHASVLQDLFAVALMLGAIDPGSVHIDQATDLVRRTIAELRTIIAPPATPSVDFGALTGGGSGKELVEILEQAPIAFRAGQTERLRLEAELSASLNRVAAFEAKKHFRLGYSHLMAAALGVATRSLEEHVARAPATDRTRVQIDIATRVLTDAAASIRATGSVGIDRGTFDLAALAAEVLEQAGRFFGFTPALQLAGPLAAVSTRIGYELLAALTELLADLGPDATADKLVVSIGVADGLVTLRVVDEGRATRTRLSGDLQDTLSGRIGQVGGTFQVRRGRPTGRVVDWQAPIDVPS